MSSEPDYNFNQPASPASEGLSLLLPFALLISAIAVILVGQTVNTFKARTSLRDTKAQYADAFRNREKMVAQSQEIQQKLTALLQDLMFLAKTDEDAKTIISKYVQQQPQAANSEPAPAPAAEAPK